MKRDEWVRVKDEGELRIGMTVEVGPCRCGRARHRKIILSEVNQPPPCGYCKVETRRFVVSDSCNDKGRTCFLRAIKEGRLYRLSDAFLNETTREKAVAAGGDR